MKVGEIPAMELTIAASPNNCFGAESMIDLEVSMVLYPMLISGPIMPGPIGTPPIFPPKRNVTVTDADGCDCSQY